MIDALVRHIKSIECHSEDFLARFGDGWSWMKSPTYCAVKDAFRSYSMHRFQERAEADAPELFDWSQ